tara:strand:+ start:2533 stop:3315 length:783 start_codon:yes stop_codon:yes gene_type:complete
MNNKNILLEEIKYKNILTLTLNNPEKRNPLSIELIDKIQSTLNNLKKNKIIKVLIIKSTGPTFCSGHNLKEISAYSNSRKRLLEIFRKCSKMMLDIRKIPQPVIACIDGTAAAAGCQLVASCDLAFSSPQSYFQTPGVNIGLFCSTPMVAISRKVAAKDIMYMLVTGEKITAKEAKDFRLINKIINRKNLNASVLKLAKNISEKSSQSIKIGKEAFYNQLELSNKKAYDYTSEVMTKNMEAKDAKEGVTAFLEKRTPKWT